MRVYFPFHIKLTIKIYIFVSEPSLFKIFFCSRIIKIRIIYISLLANINLETAKTWFELSSVNFKLFMEGVKITLNFTLYTHRILNRCTALNFTKVTFYMQNAKR
jgi:hypothetical protein